MQTKPTIKELEEMIGESSFEIMPNGQIRKKGQDMCDGQSTVKEMCDKLRVDIKGQGSVLLALKTHSVFDGKENYIDQHREMIANIMLAYRHLEDARMRVGKILQAADDGVSILDK